MKSIYDDPGRGGKDWLSTGQLEKLLNKGLVGLKLAGLPIRTRSKIVKEAVCRALGYPIPLSFRKTKPRFPALDLETYTQKSNNLQIWNDEIVTERRYAIIRPDENDDVIKVRVVRGAVLSKFDTTGTLTSKYQAAFRRKAVHSAALAEDTPMVKGLYGAAPFQMTGLLPTCRPHAGKMIPAGTLFEILRTLIGSRVPFEGSDQERNRGAALHREICSKLGYSEYKDSGGFPDIPNQLIEVKLQTSPTIDLGLVLPSDAREMPNMKPMGLKYHDVRYAVFYGDRRGDSVLLNNLLLCPGWKFFDNFEQFGGKEVNKKIQIPLPADFFD